MARRIHPFPSRTRKLSYAALKILGGKLPGKIGRCRHKYSSLAQLVEHAAVNRRVVGSSPTGGARSRAPKQVLFFWQGSKLCSMYPESAMPSGYWLLSRLCCGACKSFYRRYTVLLRQLECIVDDERIGFPTVWEYFSDFSYISIIRINTRKGFAINDCLVDVFKN